MISAGAAEVSNDCRSSAQTILPSKIGLIFMHASLSQKCEQSCFVCTIEVDGNSASNGSHCWNNRLVVSQRRSISFFSVF